MPLFLVIIIMLLSGCGTNSSSISPSATVNPVTSPAEEMNPSASPAATTLPFSSTTEATAAPPPAATDTQTPAPADTSITPKIYTTDLLLPAPGFTIDYTRTDLNRTVRPYDDEYSGQIIDTHTHLDAVSSGSLDMVLLSNVITSTNKYNIGFIIVMPVPNQQMLKNRTLIAEQYQKLLESGGDKVKLFLESGFISSWLNVSYENNSYDQKKLNDILKGLDNDISDPDCSGIGEIGLYHFNKTGSQPIIDYPPTFAPFLDVVSRIADAGMWLDLHAEPVDPDGISYEDQVFGGLELLYEQFPDLKLILSHTAMTNPTNVRRILNTYPNVMMNFKPVTNHDDWKNLEPITDSLGRIYEDWAELFEEMPERFMVGSDMKFGLCGGNDITVYGMEISQIRKILGSLDAGAAEMIAYKNAERLFK